MSEQEPETSVPDEEPEEPQEVIATGGLTLPPPGGGDAK